MLGPINYNEDEVTFAKGIQISTGEPTWGLDGSIYPLEETREQMGGASSDVGDVSWVVPEIRLGVTTAQIGTP